MGWFSTLCEQGLTEKKYMSCNLLKCQGTHLCCSPTGQSGISHSVKCLGINYLFKGRIPWFSYVFLTYCLMATSLFSAYRYSREKIWNVQGKNNTPLPFSFWWKTVGLVTLALYWVRSLFLWAKGLHWAVYASREVNNLLRFLRETRKSWQILISMHIMIVFSELCIPSVLP